jgi:hypothetical protein
LLICAGALPALAAVGCGGSATQPSGVSAGATAGATAAAAPNRAPFQWLVPAPAPPSWRRATLASGVATLSYPPRWRRAPGDTGTATAVLTAPGPVYLGYLNSTPQQGAETLSGWAAFRVGRNRAEGSRHVRLVAAAQGLRFRGAHGSCVIDEYDSRVGSHRYRELACLVSGPRATSVLVGAAPPARWATVGRQIEQAASAYLER